MHRGEEERLERELQLARRQISVLTRELVLAAALIEQLERLCHRQHGSYPQSTGIVVRSA